MKKIRKFIGFILLLVLIYLIITLQVPITFTSKKANDSYDFVLSDSITNMDARVVDIAMLGSHDAFSDGITYNSKANTNEGGIVTSKIVGILAKGLIVKMSKAQTVGAKAQLYAGVRYFDVRLTKIDNTYYTCHGYLSNTFDSYLKEVVEFLDSHPGEFIIFDIQHFYTEDGTAKKEDFEELVTFMDSIKSDNGNSIIDYIYYDSMVNEISTLTYKDVTNNKAKAGVIMLGKVSDNSLFYLRDDDATYSNENYHNIRSLWHQTNSTDDLVSGIKDEYEYLKTHDYSNVLRVNQAQRTAFIMNMTLVKSILSWSLLDMSKSTNKAIIGDEEMFKEYLTMMPIYMVDYATSNKESFNKLANTYISEYNSGL
ncbi:MAG: hypothetical protein J5666_03905 [Bacilli bacterium]|nr:hypothetical protein [Bacilli bacterium]